MGGDERSDPTRAGPDAEALLAFDRDHVWHPYSSALTPQDPYLVESAHGIRLRLRDRDGEPREVVDAMASWWCAIHGYAVPELDAAARRQLDSMSHVMFGGLTHEPAIGLARRLVDLAPGGAGARLPRRLRVGVGRGRDEDGAAVAPRGRPPAHPVLHDPRRATTATRSRRCR